MIQMCLSSENALDNSPETGLEQEIRDEVYGASERFIDDVVFIKKKMQNYPTFKDMLGESLV